MCKISVCSSTSARSRSGSLYEDPLGHCIRILLDNLCKICVSGSLCEDRLDHLYQDPAGAFIQDPCYEDTCARSVSGLLDHLYQGPMGPLLQDLCMRILLNDLYQDPLQSLVQDLI